MEKRRIIKFFGLLIFLIGIIFSLNSSLNFTGAFIGYESLIHQLSFFLGIAFLILGVIIFSTAGLYPVSHPLEQRVAVLSSIKQNPRLLRLTKEAVKNEDVEREANHLIMELTKGNFEAGLGTPGHVSGTDVFYLRGRKGARLFYRRVGENEYDIISKSGKANEDKVISAIREIYGRRAA